MLTAAKFLSDQGDRAFLGRFETLFVVLSGGVEKGAEERSPSRQPLVCVFPPCCRKRSLSGEWPIELVRAGRWETQMWFPGGFSPAGPGEGAAGVWQRGGRLGRPGPGLPPRRASPQ